MLPQYFNPYETRKYPHTLGPFDEGGIPMFLPANLKLKGNVSYHPIVIIQYALACFNLWQQGQEERKKDFLNCANWLLNNAVEDTENDFIFWPYHFDLKSPRIKAPWYSGMAQGQALSVFARAYQYSKDKKYLACAQRVIKSFHVSITQGGCSYIQEDKIFIQELAVTPPTFILNGFLYAVIGLAELLKIQQKSNVELEPYIKALKKVIHKFDTGRWSRYSIGIRFHLADKYYHEVHIKQLNYLATLLDDDLLLSYAQKFSSYNHDYGLRVKLDRMINLNILRALTLFRLDFIKYRKIAL